MAAAVRTATLVAGSAYGGAYVYNNVGPDGLRGLAADILLREHERMRRAGGSSSSDSGGGGGGGGGMSAEAGAGIEKLAKQVERLSGEVTRASGRQVVVYGGGDGVGRGGAGGFWDAMGLAGWLVFAVGFGSAVYYICVRRGVSLNDFMYVSRSAFDKTVEGISSGMKSVTTTVSSIREEVAEKMRRLEGRVERVSNELGEKIECEVEEVKEGVDGVREMLEGVNEHMRLLDGKIDTATSGIFALVKVVSSLAPEKVPRGSAFAELRRFASLTETEKGRKSIEGGVFQRARIQSGEGLSSFAEAALDAAEPKKIASTGAI